MKPLALLSLEKKLKTAIAVVKAQEATLESLPLDFYGKANALQRLENSRTEVRLLRSRIADIKLAKK